MFEAGDTVVINRDGPGYTRRWEYYNKQALVIQEHGHFSPESQTACDEMLNAFDREREEEL